MPWSEVVYGANVFFHIRKSEIYWEHWEVGQATLIEHSEEIKLDYSNYSMVTYVILTAAQRPKTPMVLLDGRNELVDKLAKYTVFEDEIHVKSVSR